MDGKSAKCASRKQMRQTWKFLKRRLKELKREETASIVRVRTACIGICKGGPILGVMPDGIWYGHCTPKVIDRIIEEHLMGGKLVSEFLIADQSSHADCSYSER